MPNVGMLRSKMDETGMTVVSIAEKSGILRETLYNRLSGKSDFKASEIAALTKVLHLTKRERDDIFFGE